MARFRTNHNKKRASHSGGMILRAGALFFIVIGLLLAFKDSFSFSNTQPEIDVDYNDLEMISADSIFFLPSSHQGTVVQHKHYVLSYVEKWEQPEWVAFELSGKALNQKWVKRTNDYRADPKIPTGSPDVQDFYGSGFDRGHLASAADMSFSQEAMSESFFMSNMSPQKPAFNKGVWRELEELGRDWARQNGHLYVITGPLFQDTSFLKIGKNQVAVPDSYFKIFLDIHRPEVKCIGFVIPNELSEERLANYATSIDEIEALSAIDFFGDLLPNDVEEKIEREYNLDLWKTDEEKFQKRIQKWNRQ